MRLSTIYMYLSINLVLASFDPLLASSINFGNTFCSTHLTLYLLYHLTLFIKVLFTNFWVESSVEFGLLIDLDTAFLIDSIYISSILGILLSNITKL